MKLTCNFLILMLFLLLSGCAIKHDYVWEEYPITAERISQYSFTAGQEIKILKGKSNDSKMLFSHIGPHKYFGSEQSLTDGIADQLAKELQKKQLEIGNSAEKSLEITVNQSIFEKEVFTWAVTLEFSIKFGNGKTKTYKVRNVSPASVYRTYNGAVALAVIEIINDPEVLKYIKGVA